MDKIFGTVLLIQNRRNVFCGNVQPPQGKKKVFCGLSQIKK